MQKTLAQSKRFKPNALYPALVITLNATILSTYAYGIDEVNLYDATQNDDQVVKLNMIVVTAEQDTHQQAKDEMFSKDVSNVYASREDIERYKGTSAADLFKGLNGVYSGDARNAGALDPNIRGIQGEGRVPLTIDGTEQATSVWMGPAGVSNRNYIDPNMVSSILVEKGVSSNPALAGIGGTVQVKTLQVDDIVRAGETFGIELKTDTSTNSVKPNESAMYYFGQDYRDISGATAGNSSYGEVDIPSMRQLPRIGDSGTDFNLNDYSYRLAIATKQEHFDLLGAYSYRQRGNYYSGTNNSSKYQTDTWQEDAIAETGADSVGGSPSISYIAKMFIPGDEISNSSSEQESTLLKGTWRITDNQTLDLGFMRNEHTFGEQIPWSVAWSLRDSDGTRRNQTQYPYSEVKQDTWNLNYSWNSDSPWFDLKAGFWTTQHDAARHQNGDLIYGIGVSWIDARIDHAWEAYTKCHVLQNPTIDCSNVSATPPEKLPNDDGRFTVTARALQLTDHKRTGFNLSNRMELLPTLDLTVAGDFTKEKLRQWDASEGQVLSDLNWGVNHMGPRSGTRQQWNGSFNFDWRPNSWLQVNAGARYSNYWSFDDKLSEKRRNQENNWAVQPEIIGERYRYKTLLTEDELAVVKAELYAGYADEIELIQEWFPEELDSFLEKYPNADAFANDGYGEQVNGYWYSFIEGTIDVPYNGTHDGFAANNPFLNGEFNPNEVVENAQGGSGTANKYKDIGTTGLVYAPQSSIADKWEQPTKQKDSAWVPHISVTAFINDDARIYARYNEFVRFPSVFESSLALAGANKRSTGAANQPEHAYNWEIGYVHNLLGFDLFSQLDYADFRINYFNNRIEDYLDRDWNFNIVQFDEKKLSGIEIQSRLDSGKYFGSLGATYRLNQEICDADYASYLDPIYNRLPACVDGGFPRTFARTSLQPKYSINLDLGTRLLDRRLELGTRVVYHSEAKNNSEALFGYSGLGFNRAYYWNPVFLIDAYASYQFNQHIKADLNISNLTNQYYLDPLARVSIPAPGRTMTAGLTFKF